MKMKSRVEKTFIYGILIFFSLLFLAPLFWMVTTSLKSPEELYLFPPKWIPSSLHFENFKEAWISQPFTQFLKNSLYGDNLSNTWSNRFIGTRRLWICEIYL